MKKLSILAFLIFCQIALSQTESNSMIENDSIFTAKDLEIKPEFPGGQNQFFTLVMKNFQVPEKFNGKIFIDFVVEKDGSLTNINVKNGNAEVDAEVLRVFALSPKWKPAKRFDKIVRAKYSLPMKFESAD